MVYFTEKNYFRRTEWDGSFIRRNEQNTDEIQKLMKIFSCVLFFFISPFLAAAEDSAETIIQDTGPGRVTDIVVVFKMHVDLGYTNWAEGVLQDYCDRMLEETLSSIEETSDLPSSEQFVWTLPGWPLNYMLENSSGDTKEGLVKALENERIIAHALPATYETEASDPENLVRGLSYSSGINRRFGLSLPRDAKLTDVPSHSRILPTLLKNAGVDILHIGCNPGSASPDVPTLFWWEGPDGSRLLTFYWAEYYGSGILPPEDWQHHTWLAMIHTHENTGSPSPREVADLLKTAKEKMPNARIRTGRISDFYDLLMKEKPDLPVVMGDMPDTWIHGYMSMPRETKTSKNLQREAYNAEMLNTQLNHWSGTNSCIDSYIDEAVENMILYDEHTFGIAMSHGNQHKWTYRDDFRVNKSLGYYDYIEKSWLEKASRIHRAERIIVPVMNRTLKHLAAGVAVEGKRIIVYNSLPWPRNGRVTMFAGIYKKDFRIYGLKDAETGKTIPVYEDYNLISFDSDTIPSMGYRSYIPMLEPVESKSSLSLDEKSHRFENGFFSIVINPETGALNSVYDKKSGRELADQNSDEGFGEYVYEQFGQERLDSYNRDYVKPGAESWANPEMGRPWVPMEESKSYRGRCEKIEYVNMGNALRATVFGRLEGPVPQDYLITYTIYENQPYIEINCGIDGKKPVALPEAGWLAFPFAISHPEYRLYRTGGIVDPRSDFTAGTNQDFYFLNTSMAMHDREDWSVALNCPSSPGISIDNPGLYKFSGRKNPSTGNVYVNLYNNQWGTNFTEWIEGSFSSTFFVWCSEGYDPEKSLVTPSEETRVPLKGVYFDGEKGELPLVQEGISLSRKGILITAFGANRDGEGTILRLWEVSGKEGLCKITLPEGNTFKTASPCNLRGESIGREAIIISGNSFENYIGANQPVTFILK